MNLQQLEATHKMDMMKTIWSLYFSSLPCRTEASSETPEIERNLTEDQNAFTMVDCQHLKLGQIPKIGKKALDDHWRI